MVAFCCCLPSKVPFCSSDVSVVVVVISRVLTGVGNIQEDGKTAFCTNVSL